jgi:hypothetical protein
LITISDCFFTAEGKIIDRVSTYMEKKDGTPRKKPSEVIAYCDGVRVKECTKCEEWKPYDDFRIDKITNDGKHPSCSTCERGYFQEYDNTPRGRVRFERRKQLEAGVIKSSDAYRAFVADYFDGKCAITGEAGEIYYDHVIPLAWGCVGNEQGNLIPMSATLNRVKRSRSIFEFVEELDRKAKHRFYAEVLPFVARENDMTVEEYTEFYKQMERSRYR